MGLIVSVTDVYLVIGEHIKETDRKYKEWDKSNQINVYLDGTMHVNELYIKQCK